MDTIYWKIKHFQQLTLEEFHDIIQLRINVFVVEQNCPYPELDNKDKKGFHIYGKNTSDQVIATARILPHQISYPEISIGRVATALELRNQNIGIQLMKETMDFIKLQFGNEKVRISAQSHLERFYNKFGFESTGKHYLEDDIPHTEMLYTP